MTTDNYHHGDLKNALIAAGLEILSESGIDGLSLRKVAKRVGVSHTAPYNHFADKQALLAAISIEGYHQLYESIAKVFREKKESPDLILEVGWAVLLFAQEDPGRYQLLFTHIMEDEFIYPEYMKTSRKNLALLEAIIQHCQKSGQLPKGDVEMAALKLWSSVHGFVCLALEQQLPQEYLDKQDLRGMMKAVIS